MTDFSKGGSVGLDANSTDNVGVITTRLDFSKATAAASTAHKLLNTPKNCKVRNVVVEVITAEGAAATATFGNSSDADGYVVSVDLNATGVTGNSGNVAEVLIDTLLTAADGIYFTPSAELDTAVIRVSAEVVSFEFSETLI